MLLKTTSREHVSNNAQHPVLGCLAEVMPYLQVCCMGRHTACTPAAQYTPAEHCRPSTSPRVCFHVFTQHPECAGR